MKADVIKTQVPCEIKFTRVAEDLVDVVVPHLNTDNIVRTTIDLRIVMNEGFTNVFKHTGQETGKPVEITYEIEDTRLTIRIKDHGKGMNINGHLPSYPDSVVGTEQNLVTNMDGDVRAMIVSPNSLDIRFYPRRIEKAQRHHLIEASHSNCMGISIISQLVDKISYTYNGNGDCGNELIMVKKLDSELRRSA